MEYFQNFSNHHPTLVLLNSHEIAMSNNMVPEMIKRSNACFFFLFLVEDPEACMKR